MTAFKLIYAIWCLVAEVEAEASYESYQEWCAEERSEAHIWDCIAASNAAPAINF